MAHYVDGFVIPLPKHKIDEYRRIAEKSGEVGRDHGALEYREWVGEDLNVKGQVPFPRLIDCKPDETVVLRGSSSTRAHRDEVNAKVMKDPRLAKLAQKRCRSTANEWLMADSKFSWAPSRPCQTEFKRSEPGQVSNSQPAHLD